MHTLNINYGNMLKLHVLNLVLVRIRKKRGYNKGGSSKKGSGTLMSNTNCQGIEN